MARGRLSISAAFNFISGWAFRTCLIRGKPQRPSGRFSIGGKALRYFGGKFRIKKDLWRILSAATAGKPFVDLFCGACNIVEGITTATERIANDNNPYLIAMWQALQQGWEPPAEVDEEMYHEAMAYELPAPECGFILQFRSFAGKYRGGMREANT